MSFRFEARGNEPKRGHRLRVREVGRARSMARAAWVRYGETLLGMTDAGRQEALRSVAGQDAQSIDLATLFMILQLALKLWSWWNDQKITTPSDQPTLEESKLITGDESDE